MKVNFYFVRHGETLFNKLGLMQGQGDSPLTDDGIKQLEETASVLRKVHFHHIYCSSSERAWDSANIIAKYHTSDPVLMKELKEFDFGKFDGEKIKDIQYRLKATEVYNDWSDVGGEDWLSFQTRVKKGFKKILAECEDEENVLIVSHGAFLLHMVEVLDPFNTNHHRDLLRQEDGTIAVPNGSVTPFVYENGKYFFDSKPLTASKLREINPKTIQFYFIRHGETKFNEKKLIQGWCDSDLTPKGEAQVRNARKELSNITFTRAYVSTTERTRETAEILLEDREIPVVYDKRLKEVYYGEAEGASIEKNDYNKEYITTNWAQFKGETLKDVQERMQLLFRDIVDSADDGDCILLISHGDFFFVLCETYFGLTKESIFQDAEKKNTNPAPNAGIASFEYQNGKFMVHHLMLEKLTK